jgi:ribosomal protein S18 acetylase RimI-like enzyme
MKSEILEDPEKRGSIRYKLYDDNVLVFMGSRVDSQYRGQGIFSELLEQILEKYKGYTIYVPLSTTTILALFLRLGFEVTEEPLRYWGKPENCTNVVKYN